MQKQVGEELGNFHETLEATKEVCRLSKKYIDSWVRQFHKEKCAFIYGKDKTKAHYIQDKNKSVFHTIERISKLDPKYINMVKEMKDRTDQQDDHVLDEL